MHTLEKLRTILYIDDNQGLLSIGSVVLSNMANLQVYACRSFNEAAIIMKYGRAELVLLEMKMDLSGIDMLAAIRKLPGLKAIPAIFLVENESDAQVGNLHVSGIIGTIRHPIDPLLLSEQVLQLWEQYADNIVAEV
jgi:response regulator RpfG family c-di-GMP phosphodiesterase